MITRSNSDGEAAAPAEGEVVVIKAADSTERGHAGRGAAAPTFPAAQVLRPTSRGIPRHPAVSHSPRAFPSDPMSACRHVATCGDTKRVLSTPIDTSGPV